VNRSQPLPPSSSPATPGPRPLWVARLAGPQAALGQQHGALAGPDVRATIAFHRGLPARLLVDDLPGTAGAVARAAFGVLTAAWQRRLVQARPAELRARTAAYLAAIGARPQDEASLAAMDTLQNCVALAARLGVPPFPSTLGALARARAQAMAAAAVPACSTLIAWGAATVDGELAFARNFDFPAVGVWDATPGFVVCAPDGGQRYGFFTARGADSAVVTVVNEAGLVIAPHTRWHRDVTWRGAMIVDLVHELARKAETLADAIALAKASPASSSWGLAIGSARERRAIAIELAGRHVEVVRPAAGATSLVTTNHYQSARMQVGEVAASPAWRLHSERRAARLAALCAEGERRGGSTPEDLVRYLGDRQEASTPGRRHQGGILAQGCNVHAAVVVPAHRRAWVGVDAAPTCEGAWAEVAWSWDGPRGAWSLGGAKAGDGADAGGGFTVTPRPTLAAAHDPAARHLRAAMVAHEHDHDPEAAAAAIERAVAAAPEDPSLRLTAAWLWLAAGQPGPALGHVDAGLEREGEPYRRGQLAAWGAWGARVAGDLVRHGRYVAALAAVEAAGIPGADGGAHLDELRRIAARPVGARPHVALVLQHAS
jgi:hypothetical protein